MNNKKNLRTGIIIVGVAVVVLALSAPASAGTCTSICTVAGAFPEINLDDTSTGVTGWEIEAGNNFEVDDMGGVAAPFKIENIPNANLVYMDSLERIGVLTSTPTEELDIRSTLPGIRLDDTSTGAGQADLHVSTNTFVIEGNTGSDIFRMDTGSPANRINITSAGLVGIGTTAPTHDLTVFSGFPHIKLDHSTASGDVRIYSGSSWGGWGNLATGNTPFSIHTTATDGALAVNSVGYVGVNGGTAGATFDAPLHVQGVNGSGVTAVVEGGSLQVQRSGVTSNIRFQVSGGTAGTQNWLFQNNVNTGVLAFRDETSGVTPFNFYPGGTALSFVVRNGRWGQGTNNPGHPIHSVTAGGARLTSGGVWTNASSRVLKTGIEALSADVALATLAALEPVTYQYKNEPGEGYVGFIAEDVPELVATGDRKALSPMDVTAVLTRVVQEQQAANEALQERVARLEALLEASK